MAKKLAHRMTPAEIRDRLKKLAKADSNPFRFENCYERAARHVQEREVLVLKLWLKPDYGTCSLCHMAGRGKVPLVPVEAEALEGFLACAHPECGLVFYRP